MFESLVPKPEPLVTPPPVDLSKVERFKTLWVIFKRGSNWINVEYETHILPDGRRHYDPELETQIKRFEDEVVKPMDELWSDLTEAERTVCDPHLEMK